MIEKSVLAPIKEAIFLVVPLLLELPRIMMPFFILIKIPAFRLLLTGRVYAKPAAKQGFCIYSVKVRNFLEESQANFLI